MASRKVAFYVVILDTPHPDYSGSTMEMILTRTELISFLRSGYKFLHVRPLERPDFSNPNLFETESDYEQS